MEFPVLVINSGSSSIKFSLIDSNTNHVLFSGMVERLGLPDAILHLSEDGTKKSSSLGKATHTSAMKAIIAALEERGLMQTMKAVGHRVVHGGEFFKASTLINHEVIDAIKTCSPYAPLHNPANLIGIDAALMALPHLPQVAVFDTAFHQTLPEHAYRYAVPQEWYSQHGVRRYGFHGTSHRFVSMEAARFLGIPLDNSAFITAHLGNGASATTILNGKSVDTSMGFTPLEGLVMGTRSGDIDPGVPPYIAGAMGISPQEVNDILNKKSGLLGLSGLSADMRELSQAAEKGDKAASLALEVFVFRLAKYIAALSISLPRLDALIFTGGIGENSAIVRSKTVSYLGILGFKLDAAANEKTVGGKKGVITSNDSVTAVVINTNEELMIALETARELDQRSAETTK
jgi:acetate kinase